MKNYTNIIFISSIICILAAASLFTWILLTVRENMQEIADLTQDGTTVEAKGNHSRVLANLLSKSEEERKELQALYVSPPDMADLLQEIEQFGTNVGASVEIKTIQDSGSVVFITASTLGSFSQAMHFIELVSNMPRAVFVESVSLRKQRTSKLWGVSVEISVLKNDS